MTITFSNCRNYESRGFVYDRESYRTDTLEIKSTVDNISTKWVRTPKTEFFIRLSEDLRRLRDGYWSGSGVSDL